MIDTEFKLASSYVTTPHPNKMKCGQYIRPEYSYKKYKMNKPTTATKFGNSHFLKDQKTLLEQEKVFFPHANAWN